MDSGPRILAVGGYGGLRPSMRAPATPEISLAEMRWVLD